MRKSLSIGVAALAAVVVASPAMAVGLGDLAKVILGGGSILKQGQTKCGSSLGLTTKESLHLTLARAAAEQALPRADFLALDGASAAEASTAAQSPTFCAETKKKKSGLLAKIGKAAKGLAGARLGI
jgi:antitoxin component of RelBE/YafQ-DinJ toxin-antitoxin module